MDSRTPRDIYFKALKENLTQEEEIILSLSASYSFFYACDILGRRFPLGELAMSRSAEISFGYARHVLFGRFPLGEPAILADEDFAHEYRLYFNLLEDDKDWSQNGF